MNLKKYYSAFNKKELKELLLKLTKGCHSKVDEDGYCWYIGVRSYNRKYCNKCKRRMKIIEEILGFNK